MRQSEMYAVKTDDGPRNFYPHPKSCRMASSKGEIARFKLIEDQDGEFRAWWNNEREEFSLCYPAEVLLNMCFPYGPEAAVERGDGHKMRVRVIEIEVVEVDW